MSGQLAPSTLADLARGFLEGRQHPAPRPARWTCDVCHAPLTTNTRHCPAHSANAREAWRLEALATARGTMPELYRDHRFAAALAQSTDPAVSLLERQVKVLADLDLVRSRVDAAQLVLWGQSGRGKSVLAACLANHILDQAVAGCADEVARRAARVRWVSAPALYRAELEHGRGKGPPPQVAEAYRASVLIVDDLGREPEPSSSSPSTLADVIFERQQSGRQTVVTTYLSPKALIDRYDAGTARRMCERGQAVQIGVLDQGGAPVSIHGARRGG